MTKVAKDPMLSSRFAWTFPRIAALGLVSLLALGGCTTTPLPNTSTQTTANMRSPSNATHAAAAMIEARREAFKIDYDAYASIGFRIDWRGFPVVGKKDHITFLNTYDDILIAQSSGATISVLETATGAVRNSDQVANRLTRFVGNFRIGSTAVISSDTEAFLIDLDTGDVFERQSFAPRVVTTKPVYISGQKIYGTTAGHVYSQYMKPAVEAWAFDLGSPIDVAPVLVGNTLVAVSRRGDIAFLDPTSGSLLAKASIYGGCEAEPVAGESMVYLASLDQSIYGFALNGQQLWRVRTEHPLHITPTYANSVLYVPSDDLGLRALDAQTGIQLWNQPDIAGRVIGMRDGKLLTWDGLTAATLDPATGDIVNRITLEGLDMLKTDKFVDGNLYAVSTGGIIAKFVPRK